jgi:hypothetical protein
MFACYEVVWEWGRVPLPHVTVLARDWLTRP